MVSLLLIAVAPITQCTSCLLITFQPPDTPLSL